MSCWGAGNQNPSKTRVMRWSTTVPSKTATDLSRAMSVPGTPQDFPFAFPLLQERGLRPLPTRRLTGRSQESARMH